MQTKQIKTGGIYDYGKSTDRRYRLRPHLAVAMGPHYLVGPERWRYSNKKVNPEEFGYKLIEDGRKADGIAILVALTETRDTLDDSLDNSESGAWPTDPEEWGAVKHVRETLALFQTGERIELDRLDVPQGWYWVVESPKKLLGEYLPARASYLAAEKAKQEQDRTEIERLDINKDRLKKIGQGLVAKKAVETPTTLHWVSPYSGWGSPKAHADPKVEVPLSVLEKLLGIEVPQQ